MSILAQVRSAQYCNPWRPLIRKCVCGAMFFASLDSPLTFECEHVTNGARELDRSWTALSASLLSLFRSIRRTYSIEVLRGRYKNSLFPYVSLCVAGCLLHGARVQFALSRSSDRRPTASRIDRSGMGVCPTDRKAASKATQSICSTRTRSIGNGK